MSEPTAPAFRDNRMTMMDSWRLRFLIVENLLFCRLSYTRG